MKRSNRKINTKISETQQKKPSQKRGSQLSKKQWIAAGIATVILCSAAGAGLAAWQMRNEGQESVIPDEVAQIENLNSRDNVVDESTAFTGERANRKEKKEAEKMKEAAKKKTVDKEVVEINGKKDEQGDSGSTDNQNSPGNGDSGENAGDQNDSGNGGNTETPEIPDEPGDTEHPENTLPQIPEPGWTTGIY